MIIIKNIKFIVPILLLLIVLVLAFSFFAIVALFLIPGLLVIYLFRNAILKNINKKSFSSHNTKFQHEKSSSYEKKNSSYIDVDYKKEEERDI